MTDARSALDAPSVLEDYPNLTPEELTEIKKYRHELREFININKENILTNGQTPDFPTI